MRAYSNRTEDAIVLVNSHAGIAYRKQLPSQRTVGAIGSEWHESTPSKASPN